jgi:hypothetical protein
MDHAIIFVRMYINAVGNSIMLQMYLGHKFYNVILKMT